MARRRDSQTRAMRAYERQVQRETGERYVGLVRGSRSFMRSLGGAEERAKGRRGVRARARQARIDAQRANDQQAIYRRAVAEGRTGGLIRQPDGGYTTNS